MVKRLRRAPVLLVLLALLTQGFVAGVRADGIDLFADWVSGDSDWTGSVAWGDVDGDGDLDLAAGNYDAPNKVYLNQNGILETTASWSSGDSDGTNSVAWGDVDGDGDLDLAVGNRFRANKVYLNQNGVLEKTASWSSDVSDWTESVAWGDVDGDGDLDLAVGSSFDANKVYLNQSGVLERNASWSSGDRDRTYSVAWGDMDGDGDLDLAAGNDGTPNKVYLNQNGVLERAASWSSDDSIWTYSVAWGDVDGDGDLDLAAGSYGDNKVYLNQNGVLERAASWSSNDWDNTYTVAWGDVDGDGDLDLAAGNRDVPNKVYLNQNGVLERTASWSSNDWGNTYSVAWGDVNEDGGLDLAVGSSVGVNKVYLNQSGVLERRNTAWTSGDSDGTISVAWGDVDGDGDLDLAAGNNNDPNKVYLNQNGVLERTASWSSGDSDDTFSVAWGDVDGDGNLDLAAGNRGAPNRVHLNQNGVLERTASWLSDDSDGTISVAWGDVDGDGDLDLVAGNDGTPNKVYLNQNGVLERAASWLSIDSDLTYSVAWGDVDGDGDLDLAAGNWFANKVYLNQNGVLERAASWSSGDRDFTYSVAWGDVDGDGDLDLAAGNELSVNKVYLNQNGVLERNASWLSIDSEHTRSLVWGDVHGDGDLDLAVGNWLGANKVYLNQNGVLERNASWLSIDSDTAQSVAWGDVDGDGDLDLAAGTYVQANKVYINGRSGRHPTNNDPILSVSRPITPAVTSFYTPPPLLTISPIPIPYTLIDHESNPVGQIAAYYSLSGGGQWFPAVATSDTITTNLAASPTGTQHTFVWDTFASGFFGRSDNVVIRMVAYPQPLASGVAISGTYRYTNTVPGPFQRPYASATTYPFRVQGTQVRVLQNGEGVANALVYRIPAGQNSGGLMASERGLPFRTDHRGYLGGRGRIAIGDRLAALVPITHTRAYTVYYTSAATTPTGLDAFTVAEPGVQELTVSTDNPLLLFNLTVSLEWDARKDATYMAQLEADLQRASELLFDATNGQAALRDVTIYHAKEKWEEADLRIHATNRLRPHALIGGSVEGLTGVNLTDPEVQVAFAPGHIEMPASWNRFGESSGSLGEDWPRALAHEFGHYYFFLLEDYLGMDEANRPVAVTTCPSLMGNVYLDENSEFHPAASWRDGGYACRQTLQHQTLGRSDWEMITTIYPWLKAPASAYSGQNPGPSTLPLAVTQIRHVTPVAPPATLDVPAYYLVHPDGSRYSASSAARAFRFYGGNLSDLGEPRQDRLQAWGGQTGEGERVCVYDVNPEKSAVGCTAVQNGVSQLVMQPQTGWLPDIQISPVSTNTLEVKVGNVATDAQLFAQLFDTTRALTTTAPAEIPLAYDDATGLYTTTIPLHLSAYLRLWDGKVPGRELVTDFSVSGAPGIKLGGTARLVLGPGSSYTFDGETHVVPEGSTLAIGNGTTLAIGNGTAEVLGDGATLAIGNGTTLAIGNGTTLAIGNGTTLAIGNGTTLTIGNGTALVIGNGATLAIGNGTTLAIGNGTTLAIGNGTAQLLPSGNGPVLSSDGQVILYVDSLAFAPGQYYTLQPATRVENPPVWATVVGQPYRLSASPGAPAIAGSSLSFRYLGRDVPPGEERFLKVFYFEESSGQWRPLETTLDTVQNAAAAVAQGPGLYVLMSTIPISLHNPGWNLIAWPVQSSRAVTESLASIAGSYRGLYGYNTGDPDPWRFFSPDPAIPDLLDSLAVLEFGRGYWIYNTEPVTLYLRGGGGEIRLADPRQTATIPEPPTTLYGEIAGGEVAPGVAVWAWIDGVRCGEGRTGEQKGVAVYGLHIVGGREIAGCGQPGRTVALALDGQMGHTLWAWQEGLHEVGLTLSPQPRLFLPQLNNGTP